MNLILGAGLAGISASYHLGHENCIVLEKNLHVYGHINSEFRDGCIWDQGPHVSFTKNSYVKDLFAQSVDDEGYEEYEIKASNYLNGKWIDHPAQSNLYQLPEPLRSECLDSFLKSRNCKTNKLDPANYGEWLERAFGPVFAKKLPFAYTRKYWTRDALDLTTSWIGSRVFYPSINDVTQGSKGPLDKSTHYITKVRYPKCGGYKTFARKMAEGINVKLGSEVCRIDLVKKKVWTLAGDCYDYNLLINTLPLPLFVSLCTDATANVREAAANLSCSQLLIVNVIADHPTIRSENWMYVYDEDKYSTRVNCTEKLTKKNAPENNTGIQVEVYFSRHRPLGVEPVKIQEVVKKELVEMGLMSSNQIDKAKAHTVYAPWANVIFDHETSPALEVIWSWLERYGLNREEQDLSPLSEWGNIRGITPSALAMAGRFGQWKYFWTDDCILRGLQLSLK